MQSHRSRQGLPAILRREIRDGDPATIFGRALRLLEADIAKTRLGASAKPRSRRFIRPGTDRKDVYKSGLPSRYIAREVRRAVWQRDGGQCAIVSADGRRCSERTFLEFHHVQAYAKRGPGTVDNLSLRCRRHNQYEAELVFGRYAGGTVAGRPDTLRCLIRRPPPGL